MIGIDSNVIIDVLKNKQDSIEKLSKLPRDELCTSEIVVYEILCGILASRNSESRLKQFKALLDTFSYIFQIDRKTSIKSAEISASLASTGKMIEHQDALIAGSFLANGCERILTNNIKDFEKIKELEVIVV